MMPSSGPGSGGGVPPGGPPAPTVTAGRIVSLSSSPGNPPSSVTTTLGAAGHHPKHTNPSAAAAAAAATAAAVVGTKKSTSGAGAHHPPTKKVKTQRRSSSGVAGGSKHAASAAAAAAAAASAAAAAATSKGAADATASAKDKSLSKDSHHQQHANKDASNQDAAAKDKADHHSRSYPRGVGIDFRKLATITLLNYIDHHGVPVRPEAPPSELAVAVARHFEAMEVDEEECIGGFLERLEVGVSNMTGNTVRCGGGGTSNIAATDYSRATAYFDGHQMPMTVRKRQRSKLAARPGEQVAAKVTRNEENGAWILASVQRFYNDSETYDVQDEDDTSKLIRLPWNHVMRLSSGTEGIFAKGTQCMAIFPETTSFYRAKISKTPVWTIDTSNKNASLIGNNMPAVKEMIVKFEDDEDDNGKTPHRRVPARYVIPLPADYFYDELDDIDLSLVLPQQQLHNNNSTNNAPVVEGAAATSTTAAASTGKSTSSK